MSTTEERCLTVECDGCGNPLTNDDWGIPHFATAAEATADAVDADWRTDGEHHWCEDCQKCTGPSVTPDPTSPDHCARCLLATDEHPGGTT